MRRDAVFFAGTTVFAAALAFLFWNQSRDGKRLNAELRQQVEELRAAQVVNAVPPAAANLVPQPQPASAAPVVPAPPVTPAAAGPAAVASVLTSAPDCETLRTQLARTNPRPNTDLATELKLTPGEAQAVAEIQQAQTVAGFCRPAAGSTDSPEQLQAQLMAILGPARFEQLQEFKTRLTTQQNMTTLTTQLKQSGAPLDSEQARQLSNTILEENRQTRREATMTFAPSDPYGRLAYEEENLKLTEERYARTLKAAQAYLRPEQLAQLRGNMTRQADAMRASVARIRASVEAGQGIPASGTVLLINGPVGATVSAPPR